MSTPAPTSPLPLAVLLVVTAAVFARALFGDFVYDDVPLIVENSALQSLGSPWTIVSQPLWQDQHGYWRPLTSLFFALGNTLGGVHGIHALALLVHLAAVVFAYRLARDLTEHPQAPLLVAALFALHPAHVESVAWATAINDPMWGCLGLLCLHQSLRFLRGSTSSLVGPVACFALALASKENALMLLPIVAALDAGTSDSNRVPAQRTKLYVGLVIVVVVYFGLRALVFGGLDAGLGRAAVNPAYTGWRFLTGPLEILAEHVKVLALPWPLTPFRTLSPDTDIDSVIYHTATVLTWLVLLILTWRQNRLAFFAFATALLVLLPTVLRFHALGSRPIQDRYLYLAVFGLAFLVAPHGPTFRTPRKIFGGAVCAVFALLSLAHVGTFRDQDTLIAHGLEHDPGSHTLITMRGSAALRRYTTTQNPADLTAAETDFREVISTAPKRAGGVYHVGLDDARIGLGWCAIYRQQFATAIQLLQPVTQQAGAPADAYAALGIAYASRSQLQSAEANMRRATELAPNNGTHHFNLGRLYGQLGQRDKARHHLQRAVTLQPGNEAAAELLRAL